MSKTQEKLEQQINKLADQVAKKKALLTLKQRAALRKTAARDRRERAHHIYTIGGMVEKMGLAELDDSLFLGMLAFLRDQISEVLTKDGHAERVKAIRARGTEYRLKGLRLDPLIATPPKKPDLMNGEAQP